MTTLETGPAETERMLKEAKPEDVETALREAQRIYFETVRSARNTHELQTRLREAAEDVLRGTFAPPAQGEEVQHTELVKQVTYAYLVDHAEAIEPEIAIHRIIEGVRREATPAGATAA